MSEAKHTPGPWIRHGRQVRGVIVGQEVPIASAKLYIVPTGPGVTGPDLVQSEANARLIAASPEMLDLLRRLEWVTGICPWCGRKSSIGHRADCDLAAVLAKATGEGSHHDD